MWMYTELKIKAALRRDKELEDKLIKEEISWDKVWRCPLLWISSYFQWNEDASLSIYMDHSILIWRWNIKNYESEIEELLEYIKPYVIEWEWYIWYEEYDKPNQILKTIDWENIIENTDAVMFV